MANSDEVQMALRDANRQRRPWAIGLLWAGVMLGIMSFWLGNKHEDLHGVVIWILGAFAVGALSVGVFLLLPIRENDRSSEQITQLNEKQLALGRNGALAAGGFCLILSLWLSFTKGLPAFGEGVGLGLFGLIAIGCGWWSLRSKKQPLTIDQVFEKLVEKRQVLFLAFIGIAVACIGMFLLLVAVKKVGWAGMPEWFGFLLLCVTFLAGGVWLNTDTSDKKSAAQVRNAVIVVGVAAGSVITIMTLVRAFVWRNDVFFRGMAGWQDEGGWRFWICAYSLLLGFALLFGSLMLARGEVRRNPGLRLAVFGYNTFLSVMLMFLFLVILNIVTYVSLPYTFNWTKSRGLYSLSNSSKHILANLKEETKVYVIIPQGGAIYNDLKVLLQNMQAETDKISVVEISPDREAGEFERLAKKYSEIARGVLLVHGPESQAAKSTARRTFIPADKLEQPKFHGQNKATRLFTGEEAIMKDLQFLMDRKQKRKVYLLQGHGELDIAKTTVRKRLSLTSTMDQHGVGELAKRLKDDNYELIGLTFQKTGVGKNVKEAVVDPATKKKEIPKDAFAVVIAGASSNLEPETLAALESYMKDRGGRLMVLMDVVTEDISAKKMITNNLNGFLKKFNVDVKDEIVLGVPGLNGIPSRLFVNVPADSKSMLGRQFSQQSFVLDNLRPVQPGKTAKDYTAEVLLEVRRQRKQIIIITEPDIRAASASPNQLLELIQEGYFRPQPAPVPTAVTVRDAKQKPRMVVIGDAEFISNEGLSTSIHGFYYALFRSSLDWLVERPGIGIAPKTTDSFRLTNIDRTKMILYPGWLMVLCILGLGTGIWIIRRR